MYMLKNLLGTAGICGLLFVASAPAGAVTIVNLGDISDPLSGGGFTEPLTITAKGAFDYEYQFDVTGPAPQFYVSVSETNTTPRGKNGIQSGLLELDSGMPPTGTLLASADILPYPSTGSQLANIDYAPLLDVGNYFVELKGTEAGTSSYAIHIGTTVTTTGAVPELSTWAMMAVGFVGLGFAGYRKARDGRVSFSV